MDEIFGPMVWQWIGLSLRWLHVIAGIAWIGSSFYFVHLDSSLRKVEGLPEGVGGEAWQVHGGGFYRMQKYLVAPADLPDSLTWFKWEAYTTWISGFFLMGVLYYANAALYMIDPTVLALPPWAAILISVVTLALGWVGYDALCKSPIGRSDIRLIAVGFVLLVIEAWQVHGGGFYRMQKYLVAPADLPDSLTWFKWEAYTTWISGFFLMGVLYYANAALYMIDPTVLALPPWAAILISVVTLALGWVGYDALCKSPIGRSDIRLIAVGFVLLVIVAWLFTLVYSGRGAFLQVGALIGTMMVANVAMVIIPNQKKVVAEMLAGREPDPLLGQQAKQRSMHNNYLTLPVLFLMISNHYPLSFASRWNWLIIAVVLIVGAVIRHFYNERHAGRGSPWWTWAVAVAGMLLVVWLGTARPVAADADPAAAAEPTEIDLAEVQNTVLGYCSMCHAEEPLWEGLATAPKGVKLDTAERIHLQAQNIYLQAVRTHAMPPPGAVEMGSDERALLAAWYEAGAPME